MMTVAGFKTRAEALAASKVITSSNVGALELNDGSWVALGDKFLQTDGRHDAWVRGIHGFCSMSDLILEGHYDPTAPMSEDAYYSSKG